MAAVAAMAAASGGAAGSRTTGTQPARSPTTMPGRRDTPLTQADQGQRPGRQPATRLRTCPDVRRRLWARTVTVTQTAVQPPSTGRTDPVT
jgi:hypothetical protein